MTMKRSFTREALFELNLSFYDEGFMGNKSKVMRVVADDIESAVKFGKELIVVEYPFTLFDDVKIDSAEFLEDVWIKND